MARKKKETISMSQSIKEAITDYTGNLFSDMDFQNLNAIVDKITNNATNLSDNMRATASKFIDDWDQLVTRRLDDKEHQLEELKKFFNCTTKYYGSIISLFTPQGYYRNGSYVTSDVDIAHVSLHILQSTPHWHKHVSGLEKLLSDYEELQITIKELGADKDDVEYGTEDMSYDELVEITKKRSLHEAEINLKISQLQFLFCKKFGIYIRKLCSDQSIRDFVKTLDMQINQVVNAKTIVHEKSNLVKLSINFGGTELLKVLKDLHNFQETL